jgi:integrase
LRLVSACRRCPIQRGRTPSTSRTPTTPRKVVSDAAWAQDDAWGTLVWLVMVTGMRRAELLALRWSDVDLMAGVVTIRRNYVRAGGKSVEKELTSLPRPRCMSS